MTEQEEFINFISYYIVPRARALGYNYPSAIISQACIESAWGKDYKARDYYNYFGMRALDWSGPTTPNGRWRAYSDTASGVDGYFTFLEYHRYDNLLEATSSYDYLLKIAQDGYDEGNPNQYANKCYNIVETYNLFVYDSDTPPTPPEPPSPPTPTPTDKNKMPLYMMIRRVR